MYTPLYESKKITDLATLTSASLAPQDLFPIVDISSKETKSITAIEIYNYFSNVPSYRATASYAYFASSSLSSSYTPTSSFSQNSNYALTASYALNGGNSYSGSGYSGTWYSLTITGSNSGTLVVSGMTPTGKAIVQINDGDLSMFSVNCDTDSVNIVLGGTVTSTTFDIKVDKLS